jgi:hypothetical protein
MSNRKLRTFNISVKVEIVPTEEAEGIEKYSEAARRETEVTVQIRAYTLNAALERFARGLDRVVE